MTLALRIAVANMFLTSLFSYRNRHFIMLESVVKKVENHIRDFITPIGWVKLGLLSHVQQIYGIKVALRDFWLTCSNVARPPGIIRKLRRDYERCRKHNSGREAGLPSGG